MIAPKKIREFAATCLVLIALNVRAQTPAPINLQPYRSIPTDLYGGNGQQRGGFNWQNSSTNSHQVDNTFQEVLATLQLGTLRFPCGTGANYWDWKNGIYLKPLFTQEVNAAPPSNLAELQAEITESAGANPIFILNLLTDPMKYDGVTNNSAYVQGTDGGTCGPSLSDQVNKAAGQLDSSTGLLATAQNHPAGSGLTQPLKLPYLELGNELYFAGNNYITPPSLPSADNTYVYPDGVHGLNGGVNYGRTATSWIAAIRTLGTTLGTQYLCAAVGAYGANQPRQLNWNSPTAGMFSVLQGEDAATLHVYPKPNLPANPTFPISVTEAQDMFASPFLAWNTMQTQNFTDGRTDSIPGSVPLWMTEYNLLDKGVDVYYGTWAHGLAVGIMSLKWLEPTNNEQMPNHQARIQKLVHFEVVGSANYADVFSSTSGLADIADNPNWTSPPTTGLWGLTAGGLVSQQVCLAAKGQTTAYELAFNGSAGPTTIADGNSDAPYASLLGWVYSGGANGTQLVILNLAAGQQTIDLSGLHLPSASELQLWSADPGLYVTDGTYLETADYLGHTSALGQCLPLQSNVSWPLADPVSNLASVVLPPFSITRITTGGTWSSPKFIVTVSPEAQTAPQGLKTVLNYTVTVTAPAGFTGTVSLSDKQRVVSGNNLNLANWPASLKASSLSLTASQPTATTMLYQTVPSTGLDGYEVSDTVTGTSGSTTSTATPVTATCEAQ